MRTRILSARSPWPQHLPLAALGLRTTTDPIRRPKRREPAEPSAPAASSPATTRSGSTRPSTTPRTSSARATFEGDPAKPYLQYIDGDDDGHVEVRGRRRAEGLLRQRLDLATRGARPAGSP